MPFATPFLAMTCIRIGIIKVRGSREELELLSEKSTKFTDK